jgi:hypothetical protein
MPPCTLAMALLDTIHCFVHMQCHAMSCNVMEPWVTAHMGLSQLARSNVDSVHARQRTCLLTCKMSITGIIVTVQAHLSMRFGTREAISTWVMALRALCLAASSACSESGWLLRMISEWISGAARLERWSWGREV